MITKHSSTDKLFVTMFIGWGVCIFHQMQKMIINHSIKYKYDIHSMCNVFRT